MRYFHMNYPIRSLAHDMPRSARDMLHKRFGEDDALSYHNIRHIMHMLDLHERYFMDRLSPVDNKLVRYAIWWHDYVYDPLAKDNERQSADRALEVLDLSNDEAGILEGLIMATKGHTPNTRLQEIIIDLDLSVLSWPRHDYVKYALAIRKEYSCYRDEDYRQGRAKVLEHIASSPLLQTLSAMQGWRQNYLGIKAHQNILWEHNRLLSDASSVEAAILGI